MIILSKLERLSILLRFLFVFATTSFLTSVVWEQTLPWIKCLNSNLTALKREPQKYQATYAVYTKGDIEDHLIHVHKVLKLFGYQRTKLENEWSLLWSHDYPFLHMRQKMRNLRPYQMVNHFPGCGFISNKVDLSTSKLLFIPRAFRIPSQNEAFLRYAKDHPGAIFVEKHNEHRGIVIRAPKDINLNSGEFFVQEYVNNPLLINGYKFDIGVYILITSVNPLRIYKYTGDVLFRYCSEKYHPFDPENVNKYVVGDNYLPTWKIPALKRYYNNFSSSMRVAFEEHIRTQAIDPAIIWSQVDEIIRQTVLAKEHNITLLLRLYQTRNFFELMRFDFIIDENCKVYLMEANMSPNLSSLHFKQNSLLYEQVLYSVFNLVGVGFPSKYTNLEKRDEENFITATKNLITYLSTCKENECDKLCKQNLCNFCLPCLNDDDYKILVNTHREHLHRTDMRRIFPKPIYDISAFDIDAEVKNLSKRNEWMTRWFYGKCLYDDSWCS